MIPATLRSAGNFRAPTPSGGRRLCPSRRPVGNIQHLGPASSEQDHALLTATDWPNSIIRVGRSVRRLCANTGYSPTARRTGQIDREAAVPAAGDRRSAVNGQRLLLNPNRVSSRPSAAQKRCDGVDGDKRTIRGSRGKDPRNPWPDSLNWKASGTLAIIRRWAW